MPTRTLLFIFLFSGITCAVSGQTPIHAYDSLLKRFLTRYIEYPDYEQNGKSGINLIHIANKNGLLFLETQYYSSDQFRIKNIDSLKSKLNNRFASLFTENFDIIFQIIFSFDKKDGISNDLQSKISKEITQLKLKKYFISESPIALIINEPIK